MNLHIPPGAKIERFENLKLEKQLEKFGEAVNTIDGFLAQALPTEPGTRHSALRGMSSTVECLEMLVRDHNAGTAEQRSRLAMVRKRVDKLFRTA